MVNFDIQSYPSTFDLLNTDTQPGNKDILGVLASLILSEQPPMIIFIHEGGGGGIIYVSCGTSVAFVPPLQCQPAFMVTVLSYFRI